MVCLAFIDLALLQIPPAFTTLQGGGNSVKPSKLQTTANRRSGDTLVVMKQSFILIGTAMYPFPTPYYQKCKAEDKILAPKASSAVASLTEYRQYLRCFE